MNNMVILDDKYFSIDPYKTKYVIMFEGRPFTAIRYYMSSDDSSIVDGLSGNVLVSNIHLTNDSYTSSIEYANRLNQENIEYLVNLYNYFYE